MNSSNIPCGNLSCNTRVKKTNTKSVIPIEYKRTKNLSFLCQSNGVTNVNIKIVKKKPNLSAIKIINNINPNVIKALVLMISFFSSNKFLF